MFAACGRRWRLSSITAMRWAFKPALDSVWAFLYKHAGLRTDRLNPYAFCLIEAGHHARHEPVPNLASSFRNYLTVASTWCRLSLTA